MSSAAVESNQRIPDTGTEHTPDIGVPVFAFVVASLLLTCIWIVACQRYLYADGADYFMDILTTRRVSDFYWARHFSHWVSQGLAVGAIQLGLRDVPTIGWIYGLTKFLHSVASLLLTAWACPRDRFGFAIFPTASCLILFVDSSFFVACEVHVAVSLFWPLLYLMLFSERLSPVRSVLVLVLAVLMTRTYECCIFFALPVAWVAFNRFNRFVDERRYGEAVVSMAVLLLAAVAFEISVYSTMYPYLESQRTNLLESVLRQFRYLPSLFSTLFLITLAPLFFLRDTQRAFKAVMAVIVVSGFNLALVPFVFPERIEPFGQYISRVQCSLLPFALSLVVLICHRFRIPSAGTVRHLWLLIAAYALFGLTYQAGCTSRWNDYCKLFIADLNTSRGVIEHTQSRIGYTGPANGYAGQFNWGWTTPTASIALSALNVGQINSIVTDRRYGSWHPFNPSDMSTWPDLSDYGVPNRVSRTEK